MKYFLCIVFAAVALAQLNPPNIAAILSKNGVNVNAANSCEKIILNESQAFVNQIFSKLIGCSDSTNCISGCLKEGREFVNTENAKAQGCPKYSSDLQPIFAKIGNILNQSDPQALQGLISLVKQA